MNARKAIRLSPPAPTRLMRMGGLVLMMGMVAACATPQEVQGPKAHVTVRTPASALPGGTYTWVDMPKSRDAESDPRVTDEAFRARLQQALDGALQAKGYRPAGDPQQADLILAYRVGVRDVEDAALVTRASSADVYQPETAVECHTGVGCSQLVTRGSGGAPVAKLATSDNVEGGLLVEVIEPKTIRVLWSAYNRGTVKRDVASQAGLDAVARDTLAALPSK